jgi:hypothetical protein
MTRNERQLRSRQLAVEDVEVGSADAAGPDREQELARRRARVLQLQEPE